MPVGRFVAATAVSVDFKTGAAGIWVGGNPAVLIRGKGGLRRIPSRHLALGLTDVGDKAAFACEPLQLEADDCVVFFSDGLAETWQDGSLEDFIVSSPQDEIFHRVQESAKQHKGHDDTSLVVLRVAQLSVDQPARAAAVPEPARTRMVLDLDARQMADPDIMHTVADMATKLGIVSADDGLFGLVFSELFSNALDHGVLGLSSELKYGGMDGFEAYVNLRGERLAALQHGHISIRIEATEFSGQPATLLRIVDSGPGFDRSALLNDGEFLEGAAAGRGIKLLMNTCHKLSFSGSGNDVTAYIPRNGQAGARLPPSLPPYYASNI